MGILLTLSLLANLVLIYKIWSSRPEVIVKAKPKKANPNGVDRRKKAHK